MNIQTKVNQFFLNTLNAQTTINKLETAIQKRDKSVIIEVIQEDSINWDVLPDFVQTLWENLIENAKELV